MSDLESLFALRDPDELIHIRVIRDDWEAPERVIVVRAAVAVAKLRWYAGRAATQEVQFKAGGRWMRLAGPKYRPDTSGLKLVSDRADASLDVAALAL